jgi:hypothetical protein
MHKNALFVAPAKIANGSKKTNTNKKDLIQRGAHFLLDFIPHLLEAFSRFFSTPVWAAGSPRSTRTPGSPCPRGAARESDRCLQSGESLEGLK